jgi:hypothetical protein
MIFLRVYRFHRRSGVTRRRAFCRGFKAAIDYDRVDVRPSGSPRHWQDVDTGIGLFGWLVIIAFIALTFGPSLLAVLP